MEERTGTRGKDAGYRIRLGKTRGFIEHGDTITHIFERDTQFSLPLRKFIGAGS